MDVVGPESCPLPADPALAAVAVALNDAGTWGTLVDRDWQLVYMTDDFRLSQGALRELVPVPLGACIYGSEAMEVMLGWSGGVFSLASWRAMLRAAGPWLLADTPGGAAAARAVVDPRLVGVLDGVVATDAPCVLTYATPSFSAGAAVDVTTTAVRLRDARGGLIGSAFLGMPQAGMAVLGVLAVTADASHHRRMLRLGRPSRRPAAILFADLEASSPLARRLSTASFFSLGRRLARAADACVVDAGGVVGRHVGDGFVALFLAEHAGSESAAARSCIEAMRALRGATAEVAARSGLRPEDLVLRFGLHWGSTLHVGHITTVARAEVNALGDEMNEAARIEACAGGGRALASKALVERLERDDADALGLDPDHLGYTALTDLPTATEKARRDAPGIAVCDV